MTRRLLQMLTLSTLVQLSLHAAEVYLKNGDKLTGHIVRREAGQLLLSHPVFGELRVPDVEIVRVQEDALPSSAAPASPPVAAKTPAPATTAPAATAAVKPAGSEEDEEEPRAHTWLKGWQRIIADTKGAFEFGYQNQKGRKNTTNVSLRANLEYTNLPNVYRFDWRYFYGDYNDTVQTDKKDWTFRWRHELNKRWFSQTNTSYASDRIKHIDLNLEQSAGVGYAALNTNRQKFNLGMSVVGQHRIVLAQDTGIIALGEFFEDYTRKINKRFSIRQEAMIQYSPIHRASYTTLNGQLVQSNGQASNYRYSFNAAIQGKITEKMALNLRFDYEFDNTVIEPELRADSRISTTIGYTF